MILITGGAGFIGSNLVASLEESGQDVLVCDRMGLNGKWQNIRKRRNIHALIRPENLFDELARINDVTAIVHLGARTDTTEQHVGLILQDNYYFSQQLYGSAVLRSIPFIYASSAATYGIGNGPLNPYAWSKHLFDLWVDRQQWPATGLKFFNVFGPNEYHKGHMQSLIAKNWTDVKFGRAFKLFEDGTQQRDFIYVDDVIKVIRFFIDNPVRGLFDVGTGVPRTFNDLANAVFYAAGIEPNIVYKPMLASLVGRWQHFTCAQPKQLTRFGFCPDDRALETAVREYVEKYLSQDDPYR